MTDRIFVADDYAAFGQRLEVTLQRRGFDVALASSIDKIFDLLASSPPF